MPHRKIAYRRTKGTHFAINGRIDGRQFDRDSEVPHALFRLDVTSMKEQANRAIQFGQAAEEDTGKHCIDQASAHHEAEEPLDGIRIQRRYKLEYVGFSW
jgi:hypothetical protein